MIRLMITPAKLRADILKLKPSFFGDAKNVLAALSKPPKSKEFKSLWSDIKQIYIDLQHSKCCFCEKPLEGKIEQDVEHFRPKAAVRVWKVPTKLDKAGVKPTLPSGGVKLEAGYTQLAYHPLNYAMACKPCNSVLKKNYFPIGGKRKAGGKDPAKLSTEKPYLLYPIGNHDSNPEALIEFKGLSPLPKVASGFNHQRALVVIELFQLNNPAMRRTLFKVCAYLIQLLFSTLELLKAATTPAKVAKHTAAIKGLTADTCPFANCMRSFRRLYDSDPATAEKYADECLNYINTKSLGKTPK